MPSRELPDCEEVANCEDMTDISIGEFLDCDEAARCENATDISINEVQEGEEVENGEKVSEDKEKEEEDMYQSMNPCTSKTAEPEAQQRTPQCILDSQNLLACNKDSNKPMENKTHTADEFMVNVTDSTCLEPATPSREVDKTDMVHLEPTMSSSTEGLEMTKPDDERISEQVIDFGPKSGRVKMNTSTYKGTYQFLCYMAWRKGVRLKGESITESL
ncbi:hypothetical protein BYT27DRAFT_7252141 [Phlegmacium glaucopus]|nr:hypothetical protein BYT27DRAFT_7252141 [Phlegmacium glaucopus]